MRALLDRLIGQANDHGLGQGTWRNVDLDFDRQRFNAEQRKGLEFREHSVHPFSIDLVRIISPAIGFVLPLLMIRTVADAKAERTLKKSSRVTR